MKREKPARPFRKGNPAKQSAGDKVARKWMEAALLKNREQLRTAFENAPEGIYFNDLNGNFLYGNRKAEEIVGYGRDELVGKNFLEAGILPQDMIEAAAAVLEYSLKGLPTGPNELEMIRKDGGRIRVEITTSVVQLFGEITVLGFVRDITERKRAEEALRESESRNKALLNALPDIMFLLNREGIFLDYHASDSAALLAPPEVFLGRSIREVLPRDIADKTMTGMDAISGGESARTFSYELEIGDKTAFFETRIVACGRNFLSIVRDITGQKCAEAVIKDSEERFRKLIENSSDISVILDCEGREVYVSDSVERTTGFRPDECIGKQSFAFLHPDDLPAIMETFAKLLEKPGEIRKGEYRHMTKDGGWVYLEAIGVNRLDDPVIKGIVMNVRDITERKKSDVALRRSEKRFREVLEGSQDILYRQRLTDGVLEFMSPSAFPVLGYTPEEMYAFAPGEENKLFHPDDLPVLKSFKEDLIAADAGNKKFIEREFRMIAKSGQFRWIHGSYQLARDAAGNPEYVVGTLKNITERKQVDEEKTLLQAQLQQAMKMEAVGRLAGGVAHDFNNLLTSITGNISLALMDLNPADPLHATLADVGKAAESAASLTKQLLAFSRKQVVEPKVINLGDLAANLNRMLVRIIGEDIDLKIISSGGLGAVRIDPVQFEQVLINLAVNARDAMLEGGELTIETANANLDAGYCRLHPHLKPGTFVMLSVKDTGHGMTPEVREHLFEPFYTTKPQGRGTGLGLAMIYGVVKQAGGLIEVDTGEGCGTTFRIFLPMVREKAEKLEKGSKAGDLKGGSETILLVEDEPMVRNMAIKIIKQLGYGVLHAEDGSRALMLAEGHKGRIDLLVTDVIMPGINGRDLADRLKSIHPETAMLFTSGYTDDILIEHGVTGEHLHFIAKPYSPQTMANKIREVLDRKI